MLRRLLHSLPRKLAQGVAVPSSRAKTHVQIGKFCDASSDQPGLRPVSERKSISFFAAQYPKHLDIAALAVLL